MVACAGGGTPSPAPPAPPSADATGGAGTGGASPTTPAAPARIAVVYATTSTGNSNFQLAQDQGIYRQNGLEVEHSTLPPPTIPAALFTNQAQFSVSACAGMIEAVAANNDLVLLATVAPRLQYMFAAGPGVTRPEDLKGKRLAVSRLGSGVDMAARYMLRYIGVDPADVTFVQVGGTPERYGALVGGSADAAILSSEEGVFLANQDGFNVIVDMAEAPVPYCNQGVIAMRQYVQDNPDVVRRFMRALVESIARFKQNRQEATDAVEAIASRDDPAKIEHLRDAWARIYPAKPYPDLAGLRFVLDELAAADPRLAPLDAEHMIEPRFIRELDESGAIDRLYQ
ncbi:MAG TPA: ABC transporter substrate-binding protein [Chloroflexota bacterium]|nr:ABC transporter substrate-binding protein [Chloroflexota bacterium]